MSQRWRQVQVWAASALLAGSIIGWPLSALWLARDEPPFVLGLSWFAIIIESVTLLTSSRVHQEQGEDKSG